MVWAVRKTKTFEELFVVRILSSSQKPRGSVSIHMNSEESIWFSDASDNMNQRKLFTSQPVLDQVDQTSLL
jgi:hypothetical protein